MFQAFFTGLSGLFSFSKNLDTVSNNIANMNTPGYRGQDTFYKSLGATDGSGVGAQISGLGYRFEQGDHTQTNNPLDMAIAGNGFFVLKDGDDLRYTRAGSFEFKDDILVDKSSGMQVMQYTSAGELTAFDISKLQTSASQPTTQVNFSKNLSTGDDLHELEVNVINDLGEEVAVKFTFTKVGTGTDITWNVTVADAQGTSLIDTSPFELKFIGSSPAAGNGSFSFKVFDSQGNFTNVTANFNGTDTVSAATSTSQGTTSDMTAALQDGRLVGALQTESMVFNADGTVTLTYDNGDEVTGPAIALANFDNDDVLELVGGAVFKAGDNKTREIGQAGSGSLGDLNAGHLELSNVDLSREFADMIIVQRGYQASSRVLNIANQMLEQLYDSTRGR